MKLTDIDFRPNMAIIGDTGTGKTHIVGTLCQLFPTVIISSDLEGLATLRKMGLSNVEIVDILDWNQVWDKFGDIRKAIKNGCRGLALDDFGATQETLVWKTHTQARGRQEEGMSREQRDEFMRKNILLANRRLQLQHWGEITGASRSFLREVKLLPWSFLIATFVEDLREHPRTGEEHLYPDLAGNLRYTVGARFSVVANTFKAPYEGKMHWCLTTLPHPRLPTKDRVGTERTWVDPTAQKLLMHFTGKEGTNEAETELEKKIGTGIQRLE